MTSMAIDVVNANLSAASGWKLDVESPMPRPRHIDQSLLLTRTLPLIYPNELTQILLQTIKDHVKTFRESKAKSLFFHICAATYLFW